MSRPLRRSSVWAVADQSSGVQRQGRYLPAAIAHPGKMLPALARQAIETYSQPGQLVLDPMCGIGTTLVEAIHLDRHAIGVELEQRWATLAAANLNHARRQGATGHGLALQADARQLGRGLLDEYRGQAALILTSPPYGPSLHGHVRKTAERVVKFNDRYSRNPDNLAHLPSEPGRRGRPSFDAVLAEILAGCKRMLTPDGRLVMTVRPYRHAGRLINLPAQLEQLAAANGLALCNRHAALLCGLRGGNLVPRASFFQIRIQRSEQFPRMLIIAHEDVLVFKPAPNHLSSRSLNNRRSGTR
jgi:SAM-dependent methyltransferase